VQGHMMCIGTAAGRVQEQFGSRPTAAAASPPASSKSSRSPPTSS
jgi:hypothetical protein